MSKVINFVISFFVLTCSFCFSQTRMPSFFSDNMVLQQQDNVAIWGTDNPGIQVEIKTSWGIEKSIITEPDGKWQTKIQTNKASFEPQEITVKGSATITLKNVLIGEVWFCSGQSNMEMPMGGFKNSPVNNAEELIASSKNANIHLFKAPRNASLSLEDDVVGTWEEAKPENVKTFSAVGYLFGRELFEKLQIPIGIIQSAWGGTRIETWLPKKNIAKYPDLKVPDTLSKIQNKQPQPTALYNAMIHPFKNFGVKGFLWYQGETNRTSPKPYKAYMHTLVNSWREQWQQINLPFYFVQIAPYAYQEYRKTPIMFHNMLREAQSLAAREIPGTGVVVTADSGKCDDIHPPEKYIIAKRLANWALANDYNFKDIAYRSPEYKSIKIKKDKATIAFNFFGKNKDNRILDSKRELRNFVVAGEDKIFYPAQVKMNRNKTVTVFSDKVKNPVAVRYGFVDCLEGTLFSNSGLPISPFRTDDWKE